MSPLLTSSKDTKYIASAVVFSVIEQKVLTGLLPFDNTLHSNRAACYHKLELYKNALKVRYYS